MCHIWLPNTYELNKGTGGICCQEHVGLQHIGLEFCVCWDKHVSVHVCTVFLSVWIELSFLFKTGAPINFPSFSFFFSLSLFLSPATIPSALFSHVLIIVMYLCVSMCDILSPRGQAAHRVQWWLLLSRVHAGHIHSHCVTAQNPQIANQERLFHNHQEVA